jgi:hypothetical protein
MLELDWWSSADIVYASSICFPDALVEGIVKKCEKLKKGARIITLKNFPTEEGSHLRLDYILKLKMSWGRCSVHLYTVI